MAKMTISTLHYQEEKYALVSEVVSWLLESADSIELNQKLPEEGRLYGAMCMRAAAQQLGLCCLSE